MKSSWKTLICAVALAMASAPGAAAASPDEARDAKPRATKQRTRAAAVRARNKARAKPPRIKQYDFLGDELKGDLVSPEGVEVLGRVGAQHTNLIQVRRDFVREIGKAAEDL